MKVAIKFDDYLIAEVHEISALLEALSKGTLCSRGWGTDDPYVPTDKRPELLFIQEYQLSEKPEPIAELQEDLRKAESRWITYFNEADKLKKELKALKDNLQVRGISIEED